MHNQIFFRRRTHAAILPSLALLLPICVETEATQINHYVMSEHLFRTWNGWAHVCWTSSRKCVWLATPWFFPTIVLAYKGHIPIGQQQLGLSQAHLNRQSISTSTTCVLLLWAHLQYICSTVAVHLQYICSGHTCSPFSHHVVKFNTQNSKMEFNTPNSNTPNSNKHIKSQ